ncbi:hypothetical protein [Microbacterium sp. PRC9]|uniref:hypothetical protein n=1 Tax=Microbacterium sp. PRC9 TaxID=2962591 RepID=UPI0028822E0D|nr:hypothetical protein [Microbacterium sp. PRC9]MDT0142793.1 hypothetical protein [Microbacterium sp. PRC9]
MAIINAQPYLFKATFKVGADEYTAHVNKAEWAPTQPTASVTDISGKVTSFGGSSAWVLNLDGFQDWATANSLTSFLTTNEGVQASVNLTVPGGSWTGTVVLAATTIGGTINTPAVFSVALQTVGKPIFSGSVVNKDNQWAIAITGTPTGGTYALEFNGYKTAPLAYNAATSAVTAAINALAGVTGYGAATITGGTASAYTIVFDREVTMVPTHALTGGTAPNVTATGV